MPKTGHADLPLHSGTVPRWLADRMMILGTQITESLIINFGRDEFLRRLSDPLWFQSFGAVLGMDWHSSGITTSVMYALKRGLNPRAHELGLVVCGGRGKYSRRTPDELLYLADKTGLEGDELVRSSRLCAKVDNTALQDGFQLYQHNFVLSIDGSWAVVQQGMNVQEKAARRYHWCSLDMAAGRNALGARDVAGGLKTAAGRDVPISPYLDSPHSGVTGENQGEILNLAHQDASKTRSTILEISKENPERIINEFRKMTDLSYRHLVMPSHEEVRSEDVNLKRLGALLATSYEAQNTDFESLLLTKQLGPRTLQSLTLVSEVIYGTPSRFTDPARFSFAHGGKDGHPFPVPLKVYDKTIEVMGECIERSKMGYDDKSECLRRLHSTALQIEKNCQPMADFDAAIERERAHSKEWGGRTVKD
ncbi:MAG: DUF763 domain-containing protein [Treponemataceae bacterium]|nr:DUF763 domain-containing protein [Treponemataceae bacterium]